MRLGLFLFLPLMMMLVACSSMAQEQYNYPLNHGNYAEFEGHLHQKESEFHSGMRPFRIRQLNGTLPFDSIRHINHHASRFSRTLVGRKLFRHSLLRVDSAKYQLFVDPVFNMGLGWDAETKERLVWNTRGLTARGSIGRKVSFATYWYENQQSFLPYMTDWIDTYQVVPGQGRIKDFTFDNAINTALGLKPKGYDFSTAAGHISYSPWQFLNFQFGHGKLFVGEGYRSMLLSDVAHNYPYLKVSTNVWRIQYDFIFAQLQDTRVPVTFESGFKKKWASFHYLSINVGKRLQVGLFEGVIFNSDSTGNGQFNWNLFNPVTYFRSVQYAADGSGNNAISGLNLKYVPFSGAAFYGQLAIDMLNFNRLAERGHVDQRIGWQLGFKMYDPFGLKKLYARIEYNGALPYTYSHNSSLQNYAHFSQPLAHPLGANFHEVVGELGYRWRDLRVEYRLSHAMVGRDSTGANYGNDIYLPDTDPARGVDAYGNTIGQGMHTRLTYQRLEISYVVNRASQLHILAGVNHRVATTALGSEQNLLFYFGLRTILRNLYYDF